MKCVIIAGGKGSRLWPLATSNTPKPLIELIQGKTLLDLTFERLRKIANPRDIYLCIAQDLKEAFLKKLPKGFDTQNIIVEPTGKNTAAAAIYAALILEKKEKDGVIALFPADHYIPDDRPLIASLKLAKKAALDDAFVVLGLKPTEPSTQYGYIVSDGPHAKLKNVCWSTKFIEKPKLALAAKLVASKKTFWNSGIYIFRTSVLLNAARTHLPQSLDKLQSGIKNRKALTEAYKNIADISLDYAITQKLKRFLVIPTHIKPNDVGSYAAITQFWPKDAFHNTVGHLSINSKNNTIHSKTKPVALLGVSDLVIIDSPEALLVAHKKDLDQIRELYLQWQKIGKSHQH